jgi:hypothetical protein
MLTQQLSRRFLLILINTSVHQLHSAKDRHPMSLLPVVAGLTQQCGVEFMVTFGRAC